MKTVLIGFTLFSICDIMELCIKILFLIVGIRNGFNISMLNEGLPAGR